jgi:F-type H+-transporting ATPase subunit delta
VAPDLLGGIRIQVGDDVKDGSVRSRIDRLAEMARNLSN